ncbi:MAG: hypothetical protein ACT4PV_04965 [Planctomycetaceae bacterium]
MDRVPLTVAETATARTPAILVVRDLADGTPVVGLRVRLTSERKVESAAGAPLKGAFSATDESGRVGFTQPPEDAIPEVEGGWTLPHYAPGEVLRDGVVWVYRHLEVTGLVHGESGEPLLDPTTVVVDCMTVGFEGHGHPDNPTPDPWSPTWLARHGIPGPQPLPTPGPSGHFSGEAPRIGGLAVRALAPGWRMTWARVATTSSTERTHVRLTLRRSYEVSGRLLDGQGRPLARVRIVAYVTQRAEYGGLNLDLLPVGGHEAYTATWSRKGNSSAVNYSQDGWTDADGQFSLDLKADGEVRLSVHAEGFLPILKSLGYLNDHRSGELLVATRPETRHAVRIHVKGEPMQRHTLVVADLELEFLQPAVSLQVTEASEIPSDWLLIGRTYHIAAFSPSGQLVSKGFLDWRGQSGVDLEQLPKRLPR